MIREPSILIVDDDDDFIQVARRAIRRAGLRVHVSVAHDGAEALTALGLSSEPVTRPETPAVVLLDLNMPVRNGWQVLDRIRDDAATRELPVVVISSSNRPDDVRRSYLLGANSFVVKRYDPGRPGSYVAEAIRYWVELNEPPPGRMEETA
jgi:two-component system response regulator